MKHVHMYIQHEKRFRLEYRKVIEQKQKTKSNNVNWNARK